MLWTAHKCCAHLTATENEMLHLVGVTCTLNHFSELMQCAAPFSKMLTDCWSFMSRQFLRSYQDGYHLIVAA